MTIQGFSDVINTYIWTRCLEYFNFPHHNSWFWMPLKVVGNTNDWIAVFYILYCILTIVWSYQLKRTKVKFDKVQFDISAMSYVIWYVISYPWHPLNWHVATCVMSIQVVKVHHWKNGMSGPFCTFIEKRARFKRAQLGLDDALVTWKTYFSIVAVCGATLRLGWHDQYL